MAKDKKVTRPSALKKVNSAGKAKLATVKPNKTEKPGKGKEVRKEASKSKSGKSKAEVISQEVMKRAREANDRDKMKAKALKDKKDESIKGKDKPNSKEEKPVKESQTKPSKNAKVEASTTPPTKRHRMKSPGVSSNSSNKVMAELEAAAKDAKKRAEMDANNVDQFLEGLMENYGDGENGFEAVLQAVKDKRKEPGENAARKKKKKAVEPEASDKESDEEKAEEEEDEAMSTEAVEEPTSDGSDDEGQEDDQSEEDSPQDVEDDEAVEEDDENSFEEPASAEEERDEDEEDDDQDETEGEREKKDQGKNEGDELQNAIAATGEVTSQMRNSTTNKKEYDTFARQIANKRLFPASLAPMLQRRKLELFGLWLDAGQSWDQVVLEVDKGQETLNLARKEMCGVQVKTLRGMFSKEKLDEILAKRYKDGLWYADDDWPKDPEEP